MNMDTQDNGHGAARTIRQSWWMPQSDQGDTARALCGGAASHDQYRPDIDGLRAVAIISVVAFHAAPNLVPGGFAGVDVFFVISGFLISGIIIRELERGSFSALKFYARRVRRLFPALIAVLTAVWIFGWLVLLPDEYQQLGRHLAAGAGFSLNLILFQDRGMYFFNPQSQLIHLWSLGVEEQFYLMWPVFLWAAWKLSSGRLTAAVLATAVASFFLNVSTTPWDSQAAFYLPWNRLWELSMGAALAHSQFAVITFARTQPEGSHRWIHWWYQYGHQVQGIVGTTLLTTSFANLNSFTDFPGWWALAPCAGALLLISAGPRSWINRYVLTHPAMVSIGLVSYPLYLWHWPILSYTHVLQGPSATHEATAVAVCAAFALAYLTYKYVELPIRHTSVRRRVAGTLCAMMGGCAVIGYLIFNQNIPSRSLNNEAIPFARAAAEDWLPDTRNTPWTTHVDGFITLGKGQRHVLFIGDSYIQQYYPRVAKLIVDHPQNTHSATFAVRGACPITSELAFAFGDEACKRHVDAAIEFAKGPSVDTVVIGACWQCYFVTMQNGQYILRPETVGALNQLRQLVHDFQTSGKRVYIVLSVPLSTRLDPRQIIRRTVVKPGFLVDIKTVPRAEIETRYGPISHELVELSRDTGASIIDPVASLCNESTCPAISPSGQPMYHDHGHLSPSYVKEHVRFLDETILSRTKDAATD